MSNWETAVARAYHDATNHSRESVHGSSHFLDWANRPSPFKEYLGPEPVALPTDFPQPDVPAMGVLAAAPHRPERRPELEDLARLLSLGAGVVRTRRLAGGETYSFRTYSSAGALYPIELYVAVGALPGLGAGLYHFHPRELTLRPLRTVDVRGALAEAADDPALAEAAAVLVLTGILWRSAWKYQARAYRHLYWDAGTMLANLLALAAGDRLGPRVVTGFVDERLNRLLGVDGEREAALALLAVGRGESRAEAAGELEPLALEARPPSRREVDYPSARELHAASRLRSADDVRRYRVPARDGDAPRSDGGDEFTVSREPLARVLRRRGSIREFSREPVPAAELAGILDRAARPIPADFPTSNEIFLIANAVEGLAPGTYRFTPPDGFGLLREGNFRAEAGYLVLEQPLGALSAATIFLMADLDVVLERLGNRGYRAAQLEAGIRTGRIYLAAFAQGLGATASTFYDHDLTSFLAPGSGLSPMLCAAVANR